jgi:uncharacterized protein YciI
MIKRSVFGVMLLVAAAVTAQTPAPAPPPSKVPKGLKQYFMGFLAKGEKWDQAPPKDELAQLMQQHLAYIKSQADAGNYKLAGPFLENARIRGFVIINAATADEAAAVINGDPMVKAGRMAAEIHPVMMADISCVLVEYEKAQATK